MVILKSPEEIEKLKASNGIVADILSELREMIRPGITTIELDIYSEELALKRGAKPAFKGYMGYPFSLCVSVNNEVVHGMPSDRALEEGDIVSLDFGVCYNEYYGDSAITIPVGKSSDIAKRLIGTTRKALTVESRRRGQGIGWVIFPLLYKGKLKLQGFLW